MYPSTIAAVAFAWNMCSPAPPAGDAVLTACLPKARDRYVATRARSERRRKSAAPSISSPHYLVSHKPLAALVILREQRIVDFRAVAEARSR
jgi:hypothetical protein